MEQAEKRKHPGLATFAVHVLGFITGLLLGLIVHPGKFTEKGE